MISQQDAAPTKLKVNFPPLAKGVGGFGISRIDRHVGLRYQVMMNAPLTLTLSHRGARGTKGLPSPTMGRGDK